jgi:outer membrane protein
MKKILLITAFLAFAFSPSFAQKTAKIGHINSEELLSLMPERKRASEKIDTISKEIEKQLRDLMTEYQGKIEKYERDAPNLSELLKKDRAEEVKNLETRIRAFQQEAQGTIEAKQQEMMEPIITKAKKAIEEVAKENGYTYVLDTSAGTVLFWEEADNLLSLVKKKLKL